MKFPFLSTNVWKCALIGESTGIAEVRSFLASIQPAPGSTTAARGPSRDSVETDGCDENVDVTRLARSLTFWSARRANADLVGQRLGLERQVERTEHLVHVDLVLGIERDQHAAAAVDEAVDRRVLLGLERRARAR